MRIGYDMMGGDNAPQANLSAATEFAQNNPDVQLYLFFDAAQPIDGLDGIVNSVPVPCDGVVGMDDHPTKAMREKQKATIPVGFHFLAEGKVDAFISTGNTGMMMVGAMMMIKPVDGVLRPAIPTMVPKLNGGLGLIADVGLNADCKAEHLRQFAILAAEYARLAQDNENPSVGLINMGEEEGKGNLLAKEAFTLLKEESKINFVGNIEGRDIFYDKADVMICDGYTGNIVLKLSESIYDILAVDQGVKNNFVERLNFENYGGTPVLGVRKPVIVGHGVSKAPAMLHMMNMAKRMIETDFCGTIAKQFA
jgi:glycerol-3-phosphate acyltransferase PlsX